MRARVVERLGRRMRFSPEGRRVRVWVEGWPGEEESEIVHGSVVEVDDGVAVLELDGPARGVHLVRAAPREPGFGLDALWFSFIAVDATDAETGEPLGRWAIRLGSRA